ncbi:MAG: hypothetical protein JW918_20090 [Anaerolineae bacterium]|nr:hypothetical protein [Anaerolineae bacterium]
MNRTRRIDFDFLRTLIVFSAFVIHFDTRIGLGGVAELSWWIQRYMFTVGGFFFFTAGYMANWVYLPRFKAGKAKTSLFLAKKGILILMLYFGYVALMHISTSTPLPNIGVNFIFGHSFFAKVLFSFGLLYLIMPPILFVVIKIGNKAVILLVVILAAFVAYSPTWNMPDSLRMIVFDRTIEFYPMLSTLITFSFGFVASVLDGVLVSRFNSKCLALLSIGLIAVHIGSLMIFPFYRNLLDRRKVLTLVESLVPYIAVLAVRPFFSIRWVQDLFERSKILCIGVKSLTFYMISNVFLGLVLVPKDSSFLVKFLVFASITSLTYTITYWHWGFSKYHRFVSGGPGSTC